MHAYPSATSALCVLPRGGAGWWNGEAQKEASMTALLRRVPRRRASMQRPYLHASATMRSQRAPTERRLAATAVRAAASCR